MNDNELSDGKIRLYILTLLFNKRKKQPKEPEIDRKKIIEILGITEEQCEFNVGYLEEKGLIEFEGTYMGGWTWAKITALGIDAIMNKADRKREFTFLGLKIPVYIENKIGLINL